MKKTILKVLSILVIVAMSFNLVSCDTGPDNGDGNNYNELNFSIVHAMATELGFEGTLDDLIAAFKGDSAYQIAVSKGYTGTEQQWLDSLVGAKGNDGITPHIGTNGNWYIGSTDTGVRAQGRDGQDGTDGKSAYQIWLDNGHSGSEADFLEWLRGQDGNNGDDGKSAYQIWLDNGHSGSQIDFLEWLKGQDGNHGNNGKSAYEIFMYHNPDYLGNEGQWINDLVTGRLVRIPVTFMSHGNENIIRMVFPNHPLLDIPAVPEKIGNLGIWDIDDFSNIAKPITVTAIYVTQGLGFTLTNNDTEYAVSAGIMDINSEELFIPAYHNNLSVAIISPTGFMGRTSLLSVAIPDNVTSISNYAFAGCTSLISVIFKENSQLTSISNYAFLGCTSLRSIVIPDSVTSIGDYAFADCTSLTSIVIPDSVTSIGDWAFAGCTGLMSVIFKGNSQLTSISNYAFWGCTSLRSIVIPDSVTSIGDYAFAGCTDLTSVTFSKNSQLTSIGGYAFTGCMGLTSIVIPNSVTSIGVIAFGNSILSSSLARVFYGGANLAAWDAISICSSNSFFTRVTRYYYSATQPIESGNFWRFDTDGVTPIIWTK